MKKFLLYFLLFGCLLFISDRIIALGFDTIAYHSKFRWINLHHENPDYYLIGDSRGVNSIHEIEFDQSFEKDLLNISFNGMNYYEIKHLTKFIDKEKLLIIEVSSILIQSSKLDSVERYDKFRPFKKLRKSESAGNILRTYYLNSPLTFRVLYHLLKSDKNWIKTRSVSKNEVDYLSNWHESFAYNTLHFDRYKNFLDSNGYNYLFFYAPVHSEYLKKIENWTEINESLKNNLGHRYLDLSSFLTENRHFADLIHSNKSGALLIQDELASYIEEHL